MGQVEPEFVGSGDAFGSGGRFLIAGPPSARSRVEAAMEVFFPGSNRVTQQFTVQFIELRERETSLRRTGPCDAVPGRMRQRRAAVRCGLSRSSELSSFGRLRSLPRVSHRALAATGISMQLASDCS